MNGEGEDSIQTYVLAKDAYGAWLKPSTFIKEYSGKDRSVVTLFCRMIDRGRKVKAKDLSLCRDILLEHLELPAPILELALRNEGMALTLSDDDDWRLDFFRFPDIENRLPNIYGQEDSSLLHAWIQRWRERHLTFRNYLETEYNIHFCEGSSNPCFPIKSEEQGIKKALQQAQQKNFQIDNDLIKPFSTKSGNIRELRSYGDGVRIFFVLDSGRPVIGGFYRKSTAMSQKKSAKNAADRLKRQGFIK